MAKEPQKQDIVHDGDLPYQTRGFIRNIYAEIEAGRGFVPFIGAGFSAPSGAPIIMEIQEYLQRCICVCLGIDRTLTGVTVSRWNPRSDQWPPLVDRERKGSPSWEEKVFDQINSEKKKAKNLKDEIVKNPADAGRIERLRAVETELELLASAHGAMGDWRRALVWLALVEVGEDRHSAKLSGGTPRQEVIDACFRAVLKDKEPTLGHKMVGALAGALRMDLVLTTNFDELIEKGFQFARNPLTTVEIPLGTHLPERSAVSDVRALIKLHGGRSSVRANESLDESPSQEDKNRFLQYFLSAKGRATFNLKRKIDEGEWMGDEHDQVHIQESELEFESHLLVLGCGGKEKRVLDYIRHICHCLNGPRNDKESNAGSQEKGKFKVFWVCYSANDYREITAYFKKHKIDHALEILRHSHASLLLLELYQFLRLELPPVGCIFPAISRTSQAPLLCNDMRGQLGLEIDPQSNERHKKEAEKKRKDFLAKINEIHTKLKSHPKESQGSCVVGWASDEAAMMSAGSEVYRKVEMERGSLCLWIDMNDICSAENLYEVLIESMYAKLGIEDWLPGATRRAPKGGSDQKFDFNAFYDNTRESYRSELRRLVRSTQKNWYIFLNCEEVPGANLREDVNDIGNGWVEEDEPSERDVVELNKDAFACRQGFAMLAELMVSEGISMFINLRRIKNQASVARTENLIELLKLPPGNLIQFSEFPKVYDVHQQIEKAKAWFAGDERRKHFLHALSLMQRPRLLGTIWSKAASPNRSALESNPREPFSWLDSLEDQGLIRSKPGGFIWIHSILRQELRKIFNPIQEEGSQDQGERHQEWVDQALVEANIHADLGDWYQHVVDATESPAAVCESAFHYCMAGQIYAKVVLDCPKTDDGKHNQERVFNRAITCFDAAAATLRSNSYLIQTHGYSRGSCRRLEQIGKIIVLTPSLDAQIETSFKAEVRDKFQEKCVEIAHSTKSVWIACSEVMRAIAREVGEDFKAYERHRLNALVRMGRSWTDALRQSASTTPQNSFSLDFADALAGDDPEYAKLREKHQRLKSAGHPNRHAIDEARREIFRYMVVSPDWIRWNRWSVMLHISSRSYQPAQWILQSILGEGTSSRYEKLDLPTQRHRLELLRLIEQYVELTLLEASLHQRSSGLKGDTTATDIRSYLDCADHLIRRGLRLADKIRHMDPSTEAHDIAQANWCETRLLMHRSVVRARKNPKKSADALAILSEAEARLRISDLRRSRTELAMVDIHRAELKLCEAVSKLPDQFDNQFEVLAEHVIGRTWDESSKANYSSFEIEINNSSRHCHALASDCLRFLGRAAPVLRERRRNVWWTTWYFERRMRVISILLITSMFDKRSPIPILGLEAAMRATQTECEQLMEDTVRMVRVDAYRLASVINTLILCIQAFQIRLAVDMHEFKYKPTDPRLLRYRQGALLFSLKESLKHLERVKENGASVRKDKYQLGTDVLNFIKGVETKGHKLLTLGKNKDYIKDFEESQGVHRPVDCAVVESADAPANPSVKMR